MQTLEEWQDEQRELISSFVKYWRHLQLEEGESNFPEQMNSGDWDEQFSFYREEV